MSKALLIVAAGKSSRFGGYPKALCQIGEKLNAQNTIEKAKSIFDDIYLGLNEETVKNYPNLKVDAKVLSITTGQGDALSMLKLLRLIQKDNADIDQVYVCWGDGYFVDELPFVELDRQITNEDFAVACSIDERPYAWFDVDENGYIVNSHFKKLEGEIEKGIHDQSLFCFNLKKIMNAITEYRESIGIHSEDYDENEKKEVKLLDVFMYCYKTGKPVKSILIGTNKVLSFNTREELDKIVEVYCRK